MLRLNLQIFVKTLFFVNAISFTKKVQKLKSRVVVEH